MKIEWKMCVCLAARLCALNIDVLCRFFVFIIAFVASLQALKSSIFCSVRARDRKAREKLGKSPHKILDRSNRLWGTMWACENDCVTLMTARTQLFTQCGSLVSFSLAKAFSRKSPQTRLRLTFWKIVSRIHPAATHLQTWCRTNTKASHWRPSERK